MASTGDALDVTHLDIPRAFIDASVLMAATLSAVGWARTLFSDELHERIELVASAYVLVESERNLYRKAPHGLGMFLELRDRLRGRVVNAAAELVVDVAEQIEPKDAPIVAGAIASGSTYLVTYDRRHLLSQADLIHRLYGIVVVTPDVLIARLSIG